MNRRNKNSDINYRSLEPRQLLSASGNPCSLVLLDSATSTLFITAEQTNVAGADFVSDISVHVDQSTGELVYTEANRDEQRFQVSDVSRISYKGTHGSDRFLNKTAIESRIVGYGGDDFLQGGGRADRMIGGNGDDTLIGGRGSDYLAGNKGDDQLLDNRTGDDGNDRMFGGDGVDTFFSGVGNDFIVAGAGDDIVEAGAGNDYINGGDGIDNILGGTDRDVVFGGDGDDVINGEAGDDRIFGQAGEDRIHGNEGLDTLFGGDGNDIIYGDEGNDKLVGNEGNDYLSGGEGSDRIQSAIVSTLDAPSGFDYIDSGIDDVADTVIRHRFDYVVAHADDFLVDVSDIRAGEQVAFLEANKHVAGWNETASGLQVRTVVEGTGASPVSTDRVRVNYTGTFIDGTVFDSNGPIEFGLDRVITGWTEGLQLMKVGGTAELAIPMELGYGLNGSGSGSIPGRTTLLFTVELLAIL